ncbi:MAG: hypothetical protein BGO23_04310 [Solirubrobacterales bacterium 67-14]|nr:MAG: hypothetical protein BGO23_04310 [Solirubrobacterales bacterium 67-14]
MLSAAAISILASTIGNNEFPVARLVIRFTGKVKSSFAAVRVPSSATFAASVAGLSGGSRLGSTIFAQVSDILITPVSSLKLTF